MKIEVTISLSITDGMPKVAWEQTGKFKTYQMSRYNLKVWTELSETPKDYPIREEIRKCIYKINWKQFK